MKSTPLLCRGDNSLLVIVDMQSRLLDAMPGDERDGIIDNTRKLVKAATLLNVPLLATEQYPKGLGHTDASLAAELQSVQAIEKTCFSCMASDPFSQSVESSARNQVVICGVEAHVCVLQTALELLASGREVYVVQDAVSSRRRDNKLNALQRIVQAGGVVTNVESVLFEWLRDAKHGGFKEISSLIR